MLYADKWVRGKPDPLIRRHEGSSPSVSIARLDGPERVANGPRWDAMLITLRIVLVRFQALGFQGVHLHITKGVEILAPHFYTSP